MSRATSTVACFISTILQIAGLGAVLVLTPACGSRTPAAPSPSAPTSPSTGLGFEGVWQGEYRLTRCLGDLDCVGVLGSLHPFTLRVLQAGSSFTGFLETRWFVADVAGAIDQDGQLVLTGRLPAASDRDPVGSVEVRSFTVRLDPQAGLAGSTQYDMHPTANARAGPTIAHTGELNWAMRKSVSNDRSSFAGTWKGRYVVRECTTVAQTICYGERPGEIHVLVLQFSQTGHDVSGEVARDGRRVPVTGYVTGQVLFLMGTVTERDTGRLVVFRLTSWQAQRDALGLLTGRFNWTEEATFESSTPPRRESHQSAELWGVTLVP